MEIDHTWLTIALSGWLSLYLYLKMAQLWRATKMFSKQGVMREMTSEMTGS